MTNALTTEEFIKKAIKKHGTKYDYSKINYVRGRDKLLIGCSKHSWFEQTGESHLRGHGCEKCARAYTAKKNKKTKIEFIEEAKKIHGNKYDYSKVNYKANDIYIRIGCPTHSWFDQRPNDHLSGKGCRKCGYSSASKKNSKSIENFLKKAIEIHGNKYDYSKVKYNGVHTNIKIGCPKHSWFEQTPNSHVHGRGCPKCYHKHEGLIAEYLNKKNIVHRSHRIGKEKKFYDFYLPKFNLLIERDGEQHYYDDGFFSSGKKNYLKNQQKNDYYKTKLAKKYGWNSKISLDKALDLTIDDFIKNKLYK